METDLQTLCAAMHAAHAARTAWLDRFQGWQRRCSEALSLSVDDMQAARADLEREFDELRGMLRHAAIGNAAW